MRKVDDDGDYQDKKLCERLEKLRCNDDLEDMDCRQLKEIENDEATVN